MRNHAPPHCLYAHLLIISPTSTPFADIGVISGVLIMKNFVLRFGGGATGEGGWELPAHTQSILTSLLAVGTFFGALLQAPVSDWFGRQKSMVIWAVCFVVGAVIQTATNDSIAQFVVGRVVAGFAVGALSGLCPLYLGETAPKAIRGLMVSCYQLLIISGIVLAYGIGWASQNAVESSASWRIPVGMQMLWGVVLIALLSALPESPRWELQNAHIDKARQTMASMRGIELQQTADGLRGDYAMEEELAEMQEFIEQETAYFKNTNYLTAYIRCFAAEKQLWRRTLQGILLQLFQQLNGQNFYYYYGPVFFQSANVQLDSYQIQFILGVVSWVATLPALYFVEKTGRRKVLLIGTLGSCVSAFIVAFVGHYGLAPSGAEPTSSQQSAGNAFIAFAVIHLIFFSAAVGPVPWVYLSENFPQHVRAKCISLGSASNWFWNFMLGYFSPGISERYGPFIMLIFGSINFVSATFIFFALPETKGLTLEQVDVMYESGAANKPWKTATWVPPTGDANRDTLGQGRKHEGQHVA